MILILLVKGARMPSLLSWMKTLKEWGFVSSLVWQEVLKVKLLVFDG